MVFSFTGLVAFALATIRATVFLVMCPPFNNRVISGRIKAMLGIALGMAVFHKVTPVTGTAEFITQAIMQAIIGASMGFVVYLLVVAVQAAGSMIDLQGGFSMGQSFDPMSMTSGAAMSRLFNMTALVMLFVSSGYQVVIMGLARSFDAVPVGMVPSFANLAQVLSTQSGQLILSALEIAGPLLGILFLTDVGLGLLTRVAPALNAFALGFPLKIFVTLTFIPALILVIPYVTDQLVGRGAELMLEVYR
ncbi:MAG: flagellar biosynthetic protein FliR [Actinomycetaceae bacterium]|nr:flagellar biosynthetic protein FliR [Actinomycetaceae bacterium]